MAVKVVCDFCDKPLEFEDGRYVIYRTKLVNTRKLLPHLCKNCANKLDDIFLECTNYQTNGDVIVKRALVNQARRERLGTKG